MTKSALVGPFRVTPAQKIEIDAAAARAGVKTTVFIRDLVLAQVAPGDAAPAASPPEVADPGLTIDGKKVEVGEKLQVRVQPQEEFLEEYVARRTQQLIGQGKITRVAERIAREEWKDRGG